MGNQIAIKAMLASYSGCMVRPIYAQHGSLRWDQIENNISRPSQYLAQTGLLVLENKTTGTNRPDSVQLVGDTVTLREAHCGDGDPSVKRNVKLSSRLARSEFVIPAGPAPSP
jgi:hypothetical protein